MSGSAHVTVVFSCVDELSPKNRVLMSCLVDELSCSPVAKLFDVADFISCVRALCFLMLLEASLQITITTLSDP